MRLAQNDEQELKHLLDELRLLQLLVFDQLLAGYVLYFLEDLGA